ncbi:MAG: FAD-dependent oxidoreductase, partial [Candidatus Acidiferrum sp.]
VSRIAVIGAGISGMAAAYLLSRDHEVYLLERDNRLGGHTHTHQIQTSRGVRPIDTGFIVHNDRTYPNLVKLFQRLGVERQKSDMSFGVSCRKTGFEYSSRGMTGLFAQTKNLFRSAHYLFLKEIVRFNRISRLILGDPAAATMTLEAYLQANDFSGDFARYYLYPMAASVWSTSMEEIASFPAVTLVRFFDNHGFLGINTQAQWYVLRGGSSQYIAPLTRPYASRVRLAAGIASVSRRSGSVQIQFNTGASESFDEIVFACHAPQALELLADPSPQERNVLGNLTTSSNNTLLHTDSRLLPRRHAARAAWNYHLGTEVRGATLTYDMNRLQSLAVPEHYCVTLNSKGLVSEKSILREMTYEHPLMNLAAIRAQGRWQEISARNHTHFCGAYWFYGFHEDGLNSAIRVARSLNVPWRPEL